MQMTVSNPNLGPDHNRDESIKFRRRFFMGTQPEQAGYCPHQAYRSETGF